nr:hypothetical protein [Tanacetum cinerariifolium]
MFDELLNGSSQVVSKSPAVTTADAPNKCQQQHTTPLNTQTSPEPTCQFLTQAPTVTSTENINQAETITENAQVKDEEFINIFCTPVQYRGETSFRHIEHIVPMVPAVGLVCCCFGLKDRCARTTRSSLMFDELLNGSSQVVSKSPAVTTADAPNKCQQQHTTPLNTQTSPEPTCQFLTQAPTVTSTENINQAETITENAQVKDEEFINIFCTP